MADKDAEPNAAGALQERAGRKRCREPSEGEPGLSGACGVILMRFCACQALQGPAQGPARCIELRYLEP